KKNEIKKPKLSTNSRTLHFIPVYYKGLGFFSQGCGHFSSTLEFLSARLEFIPSYTTDDKTAAAHVEISTSREVASF
ncbi:hypothetical protein, partial [Alloprevotella tannerae]